MTDVPRSQPPAPEDPGPGDSPLVLEVASRRRAPRYRAFIGVGIALGVLAALILTFTRPETEYGYTSVFGYTALVCGLVGGLAGGAVAVVLDRRSRPRAR